MMRTIQEIADKIGRMLDEGEACFLTWEDVALVCDRTYQVPRVVGELQKRGAIGEYIEDQGVFVVARKGDLMQCLEAAHDAGGHAWDKVKDPDAELRRIRGDE